MGSTLIRAVLVEERFFCLVPIQVAPYLDSSIVMLVRFGNEHPNEKMRLILILWTGGVNTMPVSAYQRYQIYVGSSCVILKFSILVCHM